MRGIPLFITIIMLLPLFSITYTYPVQHYTFSQPISSNDIDLIEDRNETSYIHFFDTKNDFEIFLRMYGLKKGLLNIYKHLLAIHFDKILLDNIETSPGTTVDFEVFSRKVELHDMSNIGTEGILDNIQQSVHFGTELMSNGFTGTNLKIGVVDTGADFNHPALSHINYTKKSFRGENLEAPRKHGTMVTSVIAGVFEGDRLGYAPDAHIFDAEMGADYPLSGIVGDWLGAFDWLIENEVDIINTSFGGSPEMWELIMRRVYENNILLVGSVGNYGASNDPNVEEPFTASGPGSLPYAIGVGAVDKEGIPAYFSSEGPTPSYISKPDITSIGVDVDVANIYSNGLTTDSGTSFSSPLNAGAIGVLWEAMKDKGETDIKRLKALVINSTYKLVQPWDNKIVAGNGIFNISRAWERYISGETVITSLSQYVNAPYDYLKSHHRGGLQYLDLWIDSNVELSPVFSTVGNITGLINCDNDIIIGTQRLRCNIQSFINTSYGYYSGEVVVSQNGTNTSFVLDFEIRDDQRGMILLDRYYSDFEGNMRHGHMMRPVIEELWSMGYTINENNEQFDNSTFDQVDVLWLANFIPVVSYYIEGVFGADDADLIHDFISSGGNVYIDTFSYLYENANGETVSPFSASPALDIFLERYNMQLTDAIIPDNNIQQLLYDNAVGTVRSVYDTHLMENFTDIYHFGGYISPTDINDLSVTAYAGTGHEWGNIIMSSVNEHNGKLVLSTVPFLRDKGAINNTITFLDNWGVFLTLIQWLNDESDTLSFLSTQFNDGLIEGEILYTGLGTPGITKNNASVPLFAQGNNIFNFNIEVFDDETLNFILFDEINSINRVYYHDVDDPDITYITQRYIFDEAADIYFEITEKHIDNIIVTNDRGLTLDYSLNTMSDYLRINIPKVTSIDNMTLNIAVIDIMDHQKTIEILIEFIVCDDCEPEETTWNGFTGTLTVPSEEESTTTDEYKIYSSVELDFNPIWFVCPIVLTMINYQRRKYRRHGLSSLRSEDLL